MTDPGFWPDILVRAAGFPSEGVLSLAAPAASAAADDLLLASEPDQAADDRYRRVFRDDEITVSGQLRRIAADPRFQEAVLWQNPHAHETALRPLLSGPAPELPRRSKTRQREELVAVYWQRYCAKNDTAGFFGPIGWGRWTDEDFGIRVGPPDAGTRQVFFEQWAIDALSEAFTARPGMRWWARPRRMASHAVLGRTLRRPFLPKVVLSPDDAVLLDTIDGTRTPAELAVAVGRSPAELAADLERLATSGWILWSLEPPYSRRPEEWMQHSLTLVGDEAIRAQALADLRRLTECRDAAARAASVEDLAQVLGRLDEEFQSIVGRGPTRQHGQMYAARTILVLDVHTAGRVTSGRRLRAALQAPVDLLLRSARWFTRQVAAGYSELLVARFQELARGRDDVPLPDLLAAVAADLLGHQSVVVDRAVDLLGQSWTTLLNLDGAEDTGRISRRTEALQGEARRLFPDGPPGWPTAVHHTFDVQIAAAPGALDDLRDATIVVSQLHVGTNTTRSRLFVDGHSDPGSLQLRWRADIPDRRVVPLLPKAWWATPRVAPVYFTEDDYFLSIFDDVSESPGVHVPAAGVAVRRSEDGLVCDLPNGGSMPLLAVLSEVISSRAVSHWRLLGESGHQPRVELDEVVIQRERWSVPVSEAGFAALTERPDRFLAARAWGSRLGIPRYVYVTFPQEVKPIFLDRDSPILVDIVARHIRALTRDSPDDSFVVTEALPTPEESWLPHIGGGTCGCELRLVAVDGRPVAPPC